MLSGGTSRYVHELTLLLARLAEPYGAGTASALSARHFSEDAMKAAIYARVSTANNGQDPTMQTRELREYCERRGWTVAGEYVDIGISGTKERRPELDRLLGEAHRRRFDAVVV